MRSRQQGLSKNIPGKGGRLIVAHIGNEDGFLKEPKDCYKDARLIFQAKKKTRLGGTDYHDKMTGAYFEECFEFVLTMLPVSVIVMDNASYHSQTTEKFPTQSWKKSEIQDYLTREGIGWKAPK